MFRNGSEVDGGGTAYLGPTTIIEMTIPMSQSSSSATLDDSWVLAGPIIYIYIYIFLVYGLFIIPYLFICLTNDNAS